MTSPSFLVRKANAHDITALVELARTTFHDAYEKLDKAEDIRDYVTKHFTSANFEAILREPTSDLFVAMIGTRYAGYMHLRRAAPPACVIGPAPIELVRLYLRQEEIGKGLGASMMKLAFIIALERRCRTLWLSVYDKNIHAVEFYKQWGFEDVGTKEFQFGGKVYQDPVMSVVVNQ